MFSFVFYTSPEIGRQDRHQNDL